MSGVRRCWAFCHCGMPRQPRAKAMRTPMAVRLTVCSPPSVVGMPCIRSPQRRRACPRDRGCTKTRHIPTEEAAYHHCAAGQSVRVVRSAPVRGAARLPPPYGSGCVTHRAHRRRPPCVHVSGALANECAQLHAVVGGNHFGRLFADHDGRRVRVAAGDVGHDAGVRHP
jgi:hypothetical protein